MLNIYIKIIIIIIIILTSQILWIPNTTELHVVVQHNAHAPN